SASRAPERSNWEERALAGPQVQTVSGEHTAALGPPTEPQEKVQILPLIAFPVPPCSIPVNPRASSLNG
ncbi:unnamed protein product, partial [Ixodes persulcatus]